MNKRAKSNTIRIIAGRWRGRRLPVLDSEGLRPTTDRVRETLFNWLMHDVAGARCLDLFAGTGALGLECLSRGAASVSFVESDKRVANSLLANLRSLGAHDASVSVTNAVQYLLRPPEQPFDLIFLDPPYQSDLLTSVLNSLCDQGWLAERALVYLEQSSKDRPSEVPEGWLERRSGQAGLSQYSLYHTP